MITTEEIKKKADDYIKPIYAATILGQIEWADNVENFCTVDTFNGYAFQIDVNQDTFHVWRNDVDILFFDYGEMGNKLISGNADADPTEYGDSPCEYCSAKPICRKKNNIGGKKDGLQLD